MKTYLQTGPCERVSAPPKKRCLVGGVFLLAAITLSLTARVSGAREIAAEGQAVAQAIVKDSGWSRGICLDMGSDPALAVELAKASVLSVYRVEADAAAVARTRKLAEDASLSPLRLRVELGPLDRLEYPDYCANLIIADALDEKNLARLLRPAGGVAYLRGGAAAPKGFASSAGPGVFTRLRRGPLDGAAEWTHYFNDPSNNRYSSDKLIRPPFRPLWYGEPVIPCADFWMCQALTAGGRIYLTDASPADTTKARITCLDAYNGVQLWAREVGASRYPRVEGTKEDLVGRVLHLFILPGWVMPGEMAATAERLYLAEAGRCLVLEASTGKQTSEFIAPSPTPTNYCWRYVAYAGDTLYGYADPPVAAPGSTKPAESPPVIFALDRATGAARWIRGGAVQDELGANFQPPLALGADRIFIRAGQGNLHALETRTGKTAWKAAVSNEDSWWEGVVHKDRFLLDTFSRRTYGIKRLVSSLAFSAEDGKPLETETVNGKPVFFNSSEALCRFPAGTSTDGGGCVFGSAAGKVIFFRNYYYTENPRSPLDFRSFGYNDYGGFRGSCRVPALPANGLVHILTTSRQCFCVPYRATITLQPGVEVEKPPTGEPVVERLAELAGNESPAAGPADWPAYRADGARTAVTRQDLSRPAKQIWETRVSGNPTPCIAVGDRVFLGSTDECVYALEAGSGAVRWKFYTGGPVRAAPAYENGRILAGSDDGWLYGLSAADGRLLWRFRAAPYGRRQVGFGSVVSAWPVRQGLAVDRGVVYLTAGLIPGQLIYCYAVDVQSGKMVWRFQHRSAPGEGYLAVGGDRVFLPGEKSVPIHLSKTDGKRFPTSGTWGFFAEVGYVAGREGVDEAERRQGFLVHGGGNIQMGYRQGVGYTGRIRKTGWQYSLFPAPWDKAPNTGNGYGDNTRFGDGDFFLPVFGEELLYFRSKGTLVAVSRADLSKFRAIREVKGNERDGFVKWRAAGLPCGEPTWAILAAGGKTEEPATLLAGGPKGVTAVDAADGKPRWSAELPGSTLSPAVARGRVFLTSSDGMVRCLAAQ